MKIARPFSRDSHLTFSLLFAILALLLFTFSLPGFLQDSGLLSLTIAVFGTVMFYASLALNRKQWLISPIIGIAITFASTLYSSTVYSGNLCGVIQFNQGYPYPWMQRFSISNGRCPVYYLPIGGGLQQIRLLPSLVITYSGFIADTFFYTLITLAILELVAARRVRKSQVDPTQIQKR